MIVHIILEYLQEVQEEIVLIILEYFQEVPLEDSPINFGILEQEIWVENSRFNFWIFAGGPTRW